MSQMDEHALCLGQHRIVGCPFHGLVRSARLTLPNGAHKDSIWFANGVRGSYRLAVPGVPPVARSPAEAASDLAAGYQWRTDAVVNMRNNSAQLSVYGRGGVTAQALYAAAPGNCWTISLPFNMDANPDKTWLVNVAELKRYGQLAFAHTGEFLPLAVSLTGYDSVAPLSYPVRRPLLWDSLPDGSKVIIGEAVFSPSSDNYVPSSFAGFDLLSISGTGLPGAPITASLSPLSPVLPGETMYSDALGTLAARWTIDFDAVDEFRPVAGEPCEWLYRTIENPHAVLLPPGTPSAEEPSISIATGTRTAAITGYVLGWWFALDGTPTPITLDMSYSITAAYDFSISAAGSPPPEFAYRYELSGGVCALAAGAGDVVEVGAYTWSAAVEQSCGELVELVLRVGGVEVDRYKVRAEFLYTLVYSDTIPAELGPSQRPLPPSSGATFTHKRELFVNDVLIDDDTQTGDSAVGLGDALPVRMLDPSNLSANAEVKDWLPSLTQSWFKLDVNPAVTCSGGPHWWSNHLVCLKRMQRPWPGSNGISAVYGATASPEGLTAGEIEVPAPSPTSNAETRYGARNPFTGDVLLGQTQPVTFI